MLKWAECADVETVPGKMGGRPVIVGTRIEPDTIVQDYDLGSSVEEIHDNFPTLPIATIQRILSFAHAQEPVL